MNCHTQMNTVFTTVFNRVQTGSFFLLSCVCIKYLQLGEPSPGCGVILFHIPASITVVPQKEGGLGMADLGKRRFARNALCAPDFDLLTVRFEVRRINGIDLVDAYAGVGEPLRVVRLRREEKIFQSVDGSSKNLKKTACMQKGVAVM